MYMYVHIHTHTAVASAAGLLELAFEWASTTSGGLGRPAVHICMLRAYAYM